MNIVFSLGDSKLDFLDVLFLGTPTTILPLFPKEKAIKKMELGAPKEKNYKKMEPGGTQKENQ